MESDSAAAGAPSNPSPSRLSQFWAYTPLGRVARIAVLIAVVAVVGLDVLLALTDVAEDAISTTIAQVALTASFALFAWRPPTAALALQVGAIVAVSSSAGNEPLLAVAIAAGVVVATCSVPFSLSFFSGFIALTVFAELANPGMRQVSESIALALIAAVSTVLGLAARRMIQRAAHLTDVLAERERMLESAVRVERERIADELHDFIAHELTIIAMHARVLEQSTDPEVQNESRDAIGSSARQALADIRRVLEVTHASRPVTATEEPAVERRRLLPTIADVERELAVTGTRVEADGVVAVASRMSRTMEMAFARFLREAATNIVKHAGSTETVSIRFASSDDDVVMRIQNTTPGAANSLALPPGGYGIARMRERATVLGGSFSAGPTSEGWLVEVQLPIR